MSEPASDLSWVNVAIGLGFIAFDAVLSLGLGLGIGGSLIVAATRCIVQLTVMGLVLDKVFAAQNVWGVAGIARTLLMPERWPPRVAQPETLTMHTVHKEYNRGGRPWLTAQSCSTCWALSSARSTSPRGAS